MKELLIEEKAKAYDEAKKARKLATDLPNGREDRLYHVWDLEYIFPQLKESEDEKIRKEIIYHIKNCDDTIDEETEKRMLSWLEKQGEPTDINPSEFDLRLNKLLKQFEKLPKEEIESSLAFYLNVVQNNGAYKEKQGEQKPTKWSEEDEKKRRLLIAILNVNHPNANFKVNPINTTEMEAMSTGELVDWLKSLRPQPKQKWSEEDERMIIKICQNLYDYPRIKSPFDDKSFKEAQKEVQFVKSLRPQNRWKPTDEQMDALYTYIYNPQYFNSPDPRMELVESVYKDLKKLKEE